MRKKKKGKKGARRSKEVKNITYREAVREYGFVPGCSGKIRFFLPSLFFTLDVAFCCFLLYYVNKMQWRKK
jgi:hypothetical protein